MARVCGADCVAVFHALHSRGRMGKAILQAFDLLELNSEAFRPLSLGDHKNRFWHGCWLVSRLASRLTSTRTRPASSYSGKPARWFWWGSGVLDQKQEPGQLTRAKAASHPVPRIRNGARISWLRLHN
jgi:hypothetical protein